MRTPIPDMMEGEGRRTLRLETLVRLRWLAAAGQIVTIIVVAFGLGFSMPLIPVMVLIAALAIGNLVLALRFPLTQRVSPGSAFIMIGFDILQLSALLFLTGGLANPFVALISVPVIISFTALPLKHALTLLGLAIICVSGFALTPFALPWHDGEMLEVDPVLRLGIWIGILAMLAFAAFYARRISLEAQQMADALAATELVLQREQHLSELDGLAAAAAHELGTPLATILLVAKEMAGTLGKDERHGEDVMLLVSQAQRCREILARLTAMSKEDEAHMRLLPLSSLVEDVVAPHRPFISNIEIVYEGAREDEPVGIRNPGIIFGLGNIVENAVEHAEEKVRLTVAHDDNTVSIVIEDDGSGYPAEILPRIGDPFVSGRGREAGTARAGGMGLGLFIAKTLLERSGATLRFTNREPEGSGARIAVSWPRRRMEAD
ncbi:ActS/PrrB/RegB family redox-sensitive histidine kinase [Martelella alba]|uniref:histidine kinase n=1 Tax=Martelella alba TaxID=2590451 RepID=A0A506U5R3_9HYPH|nr:ActS/PrrB/RegB family redox-sensitive histidine kinase [Martelella alba]TPW28424.1 ActS/PrrB/RegB family redox-sensitive histidine kinase [Martelella alba]